MVAATGGEEPYLMQRGDQGFQYKVYHGLERAQASFDLPE